MWILEFLKNIFKGRGLYVIIIVIFSWITVFVLLCLLIFQVFLYIFRVRYKNREFEAAVNKEITNVKKE